ncbi:MAG: arginine N-succinyltransferase, partial [Candidatus Competibacterales bacterium]|nr:arginine N-succinyltransferase [Candidatus Competibacterales bacterium]
MLVLRPSAPNDLEALLRLAELTGPGMTNLPPDRKVLNAKLQASAAAFARNIGPGDAPRDEAYLLLLEDTDSGQVVGCGGVFAGVGLDRPFYSYRLLSVPHTSASLGVYRSYRVLQLVNEYEGAAEVGVLFLEPDRRRDGNGRFLSRARFLFVAEFRERFPKQIMAEMRGVQDASGDAVFWQHLGRHFFPLDFGAADRLSARGETQFIADLMPKHPVYACLLPQVAQAVLGVAHPDSRPAMALLEREGFRFEGCVDVFDAGPTLHCPIDTVHTV